MDSIKGFQHDLFHTTSENFSAAALTLFEFQSKNNPIYKQYLSLIGCESSIVTSINDIPFLPISFFKTHQITCGNRKVEKTFTSSGTSSTPLSSHHVADLSVYTQSAIKCFEYFYGPVSDYCILALLPNYIEQENSSLIFMVSELIKASKSPLSGFYKDDFNKLSAALAKLESTKQKTLLIGTVYALLDLCKVKPTTLTHCQIMETGGMKGKRQEMTKSQLHNELKDGFSLQTIHSEYGMTELLSQAYSKGNGIFYTPPWMKVLIRDINDPFQLVDKNQSGGINVIDLANIYSCAFIGTDDLGKSNGESGFEILGRLKQSDIRGCNLMGEQMLKS